MLVDDLSKSVQSGKQTDLILLDFSEAFDKVAHEKLLLKLHFYCIRGNTLNWIKDFLDNRKQSVILNGTNSDNIAVSHSVTMQNRWNNRISDVCVYAQIRKGLGMHLVTYSNHDTVPFLLIVPIKGRFV